MPSRFRNPLADLEIAKAELQSMGNTTSFREFSESWQNFLMRLERAWQTSARIIRPMKGAQQWFAPYKELRKTDPLLDYLRFARNAEIHDGDSTICKPIAINVKDKSGKGILLKNITARLDGDDLTIDMGTWDIENFVDAQLIPSDPEITTFRTREGEHAPPKKHLRKRIKSKHPVYIAELGLDFYSTFVKEADSRYGI